MITQLKRVFKAIGYPIFPIVPDCAYCAAMRFVIIGCLWTAMQLGIAVGHFWACLLVGSLDALIFIFLLYILYKMSEVESEQ